MSKMFAGDLGWNLQEQDMADRNIPYRVVEAEVIH